MAAYSWSAFFPPFLRALAGRPPTAGLYARQWATTVVGSRFGVRPDSQVGPRVALLPLPARRVELTAFAAYDRRLRRLTLSEPERQLAEVDHWMRFAAGEADGPG